MGEEMQAASLEQNVEEIRRIGQSYADTESMLANLLEEWEAAHEANC